MEDDDTPAVTGDAPAEPAPIIDDTSPARVVAAHEIRVTAHVSVRGVRAGETAVVADDDEWRALAANGLVEVVR